MVRHRVLTAIIVTVAALVMLTGAGQRLLDSHSNFGDADHLAALSLIMSGVPEGALPVTLLDVDDKTRLAWGATGTTPHAALAGLIKEAADNGAAAIVVDFDLTPDSPAQAGDPALARTFAAAIPPMRRNLCWCARSVFCGGRAAAVRRRFRRLPVCKLLTTPTSKANRISVG